MWRGAQASGIAAPARTADPGRSRAPPARRSRRPGPAGPLRCADGRRRLALAPARLPAVGRRPDPDCGRPPPVVRHPPRVRPRHVVPRASLASDRRAGCRRAVADAVRIVAARPRTASQVDGMAGSRPDRRRADAAGAFPARTHGGERLLEAVDSALFLRLPAGELLEPAPAAPHVPGAARSPSPGRRARLAGRRLRGHRGGGGCDDVRPGGRRGGSLEFHGRGRPASQPARTRAATPQPRRPPCGRIPRRNRRSSPARCACRRGRPRGFCTSTRTSSTTCIRSCPAIACARIAYEPQHEIGWWDWVRRAKRLPGEVLLFQNRRRLGMGPVMPPLDPAACALLFLLAFTLAGVAQTTWFRWPLSHVFDLPLDGELTFRGRRSSAATRPSAGSS